MNEQNQYGLARRHRDLLQAAADLGGVTNAKMLADHLGLGSSTIRSYWQEIQEQMQVHSRSEALWQANELGLILPRQPCEG